MAARPVRLVLCMAAALSPVACWSPQPVSTPPPRVAPTTASPVVNDQQPLAFELNQGQTDDQVAFLARAAGYRLFLTPDEAVLALGPAPPSACRPSGPTPRLRSPASTGAPPP